MATKKQKQELIDTLKWTPRTYSIHLYAYGGETYAGRVDRKIYDFFKKHRIDIEQYASDWDDAKWEFVPDDMRPFPPGAPFECEGLYHCSGATMDGSNMVEVTDENGDTVWSCSLDLNDLEAAGVEIECFAETIIGDEPEGTVIFSGGQGEKGTLFGGTFELRQPFEPSKLRITYEDCDGWAMANSVSYDGEDISNDDYSTTGKWAEAKWIIIGDEEVYEGVERDDDGNMEEDEFDPAEELENISAPEISWQSGNPSKAGEYHVLIDAPWPNGGLGTAEWTGKTWKKDGKKVKVTQWGISDDLHDSFVSDNEELEKIMEEFEPSAGRSPWFDADVKPLRKGLYECEFQGSTWPFPLMCEWTGKTWKEEGKKITNVARWRGLSENPDK